MTSRGNHARKPQTMYTAGAWNVFVGIQIRSHHLRYGIFAVSMAFQIIPLKEKHGGNENDI